MPKAQSRVLHGPWTARRGAAPSLLLDAPPGSERSSDPALELEEGDLLLLVALGHLRRGDPRPVVCATLRAAAAAYRRAGTAHR